MGAAVQSVSEFNRDISGSITLGTGATACIHLLPPLLQKLHQDHPLLTVRVTVGNTLEVVGLSRRTGLIWAFVRFRRTDAAWR